MTTLQLSGGWEIVDCESKLRDKYLTSHLSLGFDLHAARFGSKKPYASAITVSDIMTTAAMRSRITGDNADAIMECADELNADLDTIPPKADLARDLQKHRRAVVSLIGRLWNISGVKLAKACKLLALKRPGLFPMLDDLVCTAYWKPQVRGGAPAAPWQRGKGWGVNAFTIMDAFRADLVASSSSINSLQSNIQTVIVKSRGVTIQLSPVRILDNLIWWGTLRTASTLRTTTLPACWCAED